MRGSKMDLKQIFFDVFKQHVEQIKTFDSPGIQEGKGSSRRRRLKPSTKKKKVDRS
tara:strand:+ start:9209 stop:9376 length:168 start_codon:yes stop_codon:yes gene_type:complete